MAILIGLGGNLGNVADTFDSALTMLDQMPDIRVVRASSYLPTRPMGTGTESAFLNAAAELETRYCAWDLLQILHEVETQHGRLRESHWASRTLDLDLLIYRDDLMCRDQHGPHLLLPHPGCWYRKFVLDPLSEIAHNVIHPVKKQTIGDLQDRLNARPFTVGLCGGLEAMRLQLSRVLPAEFPEVEIMPWSEDAEPPTLLLWLGEPTDQTTPFDTLPLLPRLDLTAFPEPVAIAARHVLTAALG